MPLLREDDRRIRVAEQVRLRRKRSLNLAPTSGGEAREELVRRISVLGVDAFLARLWDRSGPTYRLLASSLGTKSNPSAAEHPEKAAELAAAFERVEVIDEREAEIGHRIVQELKPALEHFGFG